MRILVVDERSAERKGIALQIRKAGHEAIEAQNGYGGAALLQNRDVDIVLLDINEPGSGGDRSLITWVKRNKPTIQIVLMSGSPLVEQMAIRYGAAGYILKSFGSADVMALERFFRGN
mgnify:CR=1 FL=1